MPCEKLGVAPHIRCSGIRNSLTFGPKYDKINVTFYTRRSSGADAQDYSASRERSATLKGSFSPNPSLSTWVSSHIYPLRVGSKQHRGNTMPTKPFVAADYLITEQDIAEYRKAMDEQEVPQEGRLFEILGVVYGPEDQIPEHVKDIIKRLCS